MTPPTSLPTMIAYYNFLNRPRGVNHRRAVRKFSKNANIHPYTPSKPLKHYKVEFKLNLSPVHIWQPLSMSNRGNLYLAK